MRVIEIFGSIDGEGKRTGELATFIRLAGCNLKCSYCDTQYACKVKFGKEMSLQEILNEVDKIGYKNITLTGGEPLLFREQALNLVKALKDKGYHVNIETNGSIDITDFLLDDVLLTMDYKTPYSQQQDKMFLSNLKKLRPTDVLKFVCDKTDLSHVEQVIEDYKIQSYIYLSPVFNQIEPVELVQFLKELHQKGIDTSKIRVQVQLHKIIWQPEERGV